MQRVRFAILAGAALAGVPFIALASIGPRGATVGAVFDQAVYLCTGGGAAAHVHPVGVYMPMFSTPPKGGVTYNGPPLDDC